MFGFDNDTIYDFEKRNNDYCPSLEELHSFFDSVDEVTLSAMDTRGVDDVQKVTPPTLVQMVGATVDTDATIRIPPLPVVTPISMQSECDFVMTLAS